MSKRADLQVSKIKKSFPDPSPLVAQTISAVTNTSAGALNAQSYTGGVVQVRLLPRTVDIKVCWGPDNAVIGNALLDVTTKDDYVQLWETVPAGQWFERNFDTAIDLFVMRSTGADTEVETQVVPA